MEKLPDYLDPRIGYTPSDDKTAQNIGNELIKLLGLKVKQNGRIDTEWGDKTPAGLARTVYRIVNGEPV